MNQEHLLKIYKIVKAKTVNESKNHARFKMADYYYNSYFSPDINLKTLTIFNESLDVLDVLDVFFLFKINISKNFKNLKLEKIINDELINIENNLLPENVKKFTYDGLYGAMALASIASGLLNEKSIINLKKYVFSFIKLTHLGNSIPCHEAIKYTNELDFSNIKDSINLGLAHGILGVIIFLSKNLKYCSTNEKTLLESFIKQVLDLNDIVDPNLGLPCNSHEVNSAINRQNGWCYGDVSIGWSLLISAYYLKNNKTEIDATRILLRGLKRSLIETENIFFCHGFSGNAIIAKRAYHLTNNIEFKHLSIKIFNRAIENLLKCNKMDLHILEGSGSLLLLIHDFSNYDMLPENNVVTDYLGISIPVT